MTKTLNAKLFEMTADTAILYKHLTAMEPGDTVSYREMSTMLGREIRGDNSHLQSALRAASRDSGAVFDCVRNVGYRRLTDSEIVQTSAPRTARLRKRVEREGKRLAMVANFDALAINLKQDHNARVSVLGAIAQALKPKAIAEVRNHVSTSMETLPIAKTLEMLGRKA